MRFSELFEARLIMDVRHVLSDIPYFGAEKNPEHIDPKDGFYFEYSDGYLIIGSTHNPIYDALVVYGEDAMVRKGYGVKVAFPDESYEKAISTTHNAFGGLVDLKARTITISKEFDSKSKLRMRDHVRIKNEQKGLLELFKYGVDEDFVIKGMPPNSPKTVRDYLALSDTVDQWAQNKELVFYHGTTLERAAIILRSGLRPNNTPGSYVDLIPNYSEKNVYLTTWPNTALFYAKRSVKKEGGSWAILKITDIDYNRLTADDSLAGWKKPLIDQNKLIDPKPSLGWAGGGQVGYRGVIPPSKISLFKKGK